MPHTRIYMDFQHFCLGRYFFTLAYLTSSFLGCNLSFTIANITWDLHLLNHARTQLPDDHLTTLSFTWPADCYTNSTLPVAGFANNVLCQPKLFRCSRVEIFQI